MTGKRKSNRLGAKQLFFVGLAIGVGAASGGVAALAQKASTPEEEAMESAALNVYEQYKKLDLASDTKLVDLYAPEAEIESDVERKDTPTQKERYDRTKFCALITKTFSDPALAKMSAATVYDSPIVIRERLHKEAVKVEFHAYQGDTAMKINWLLRKQPSGQWLIVKEHSITYRKSIGQAKQ